MPNSSIVEDIKVKVQNELLHDELIIKTIDAQDVEGDDVSELINTHIFTFAQNPNMIVSSGTFLTIQVHVPQFVSVSQSSNPANFKWVHPVLEIWIISHNQHMRVDNLPRIRANRNDFLAQLIDEKFNGRSGFGYGQLFLQMNIEGVHPDNSDYLYRRLLFVTKDLSQGVCK